MSSRRQFLKSLLPLAGGVLAACRPVTPAAPPPAASTELPAATPAAPAETPPTPVAGRLIAVEDLYQQTYVPHVTVLKADEWSLAVEGEAAAPFTLTWGELQELPSVEQMHTLECIGNPVGGRLIGNLMWRGVPLRDLLAKAQPKTTAAFLVMSSADDYFTSVPLDLALDERSLLAFEAGGGPLPFGHGFPARILLPGVYGQKQPKWVTSLRLSDRYVEGPWEKEGWSDQAAIRINSRIEYPRRGDTLAAGRPALISGVAYSDLSGVARLEVSADDGQTWHEATLLPGPTPMVWTAWDWEWSNPPAGRHVLQARAVDGSGTAQLPVEGLLSGVFPDGTSGIHTVIVDVA